MILVKTNHPYLRVGCHNCKWSRGKEMVQFEKIGAFMQTLKSVDKSAVRF
jgi:hypothetical protein